MLLICDREATAVPTMGQQDHSAMPRPIKSRTFTSLENRTSFPSFEFTGDSQHETNPLSRLSRKATEDEASLRLDLDAAMAEDPAPLTGLRRYGTSEFQELQMDSRASVATAGKGKAKVLPLMPCAVSAIVPSHQFHNLHLLLSAYCFLSSAIVPGCYRGNCSC